MPVIDLAHPDRLWLGLALVPLAAWVARGSRNRLRDWRALGQSGRPGRDGSVGWLLGMALIVLAMAQPRWGRSVGFEVPEGHDLIFCIDVSRSMGAEDATPNRLGVAVESGLSLIREIAREPGHRAALVAFAGRSVVKCSLTSNLGAVADSLRSLRAGEVQPGGTDLGSALEAALLAFDPEEHAQGRTIVLFTDGEDHAESWPLSLERLVESGILVHSLAIGDPDRAHPVPDRALASRPNREPPAQTRRSDTAIGSIARATGGALIPLGLVSIDLGALYRDRIAPTARQRREAIHPPERVERFPAFLLAGLTIGLAGSWPSRSRRRRGWRLVGLVGLLGITSAAGPGSGSVGGLIESGRSDYQAGRFLPALRSFEQALEAEPTAAIPRYDAASALFQLKRYPEAIARYEEARKLADRALATKIDYALGNAYLATGEVARALEHYDACVGSTSKGAGIDGVRRDAAENRAFAVARKPPTPPEDSEGPAPKKASKTDRPRPSRGSGSNKGADPPPGRNGGNPSKDPATRKDAPAPRDSEASPEDPEPPETRLDRALQEIRETRRNRPPEAPPVSTSGTSKDW